MERSARPVIDRQKVPLGSSSSPVAIDGMGGSDRPRGRALRVLAVPAAHPYVQRVCTDLGVELLPELLPDGAPAGHWWPPVALQPDWIRGHRDQADVLHLHFGTESFTVAHLRETLSAARDAAWPIVFTLHDIDHPQLSDQSRYHAQLDLLVPAVDRVVTLTEGAASSAQTRWGVAATVLPHPGLLGDGAARPHGQSRPWFVLGLHLKDLRPNVDGPGAARTALHALELLAREGVDARLEVWMHSSTRDPRAAGDVREIVAGADRARLVEHDRLDDATLAHALGALDVCILPYTHGTHSGWLELCWDLGVGVAAPQVGFYREQHDDGSVRSFRWDSPDSLARAIRQLVDPADPATSRTGSDARREQVRARSAHRHRVDPVTARRQGALYRSLVPDAAMFR